MTFGLFVAIGVITGIYVGARRNLRYGIPRSETEKVALILVGIGFVGARLLWVVTHLEEIQSPIDVIAVWDGGLQFTGGFVTAILVAPLFTRKWPKDRRWELLDGADFFLGWTYTGGAVIEGPLEVGVTYHNAALYEFMWLIPIILVLLYLDKKQAPAGVMAGSFAIMYGGARFLTDFVRINDERLYGLTGAQYMTAGLTLFGVGVVWLALKRNREAEPESVEVAGTPGTPTASED